MILDVYYISGGDIMISKFSFQNYKSYRDETAFDFQAAKMIEFDDTLIKRENASSLLPVSVIYGPNGGGKSNLLMALISLISIVVKPIAQLEKNRTSVFQQHTKIRPFAFDKTSKDEPTVFDLFFRTEQKEFRYYLSIKDDEIIDECLYWRAYTGKKTATVFEREGRKIELGSSIRSKSINTEINPKMPYLSFLAINYDIPVIADAQKWFESCIIKNYANWSSESSIYIQEDDYWKSNIITCLNDMDIDISDYRFDDEVKQFFLQRDVDGQKFELNFEEESAGTKKLFSMIPFVLLALQQGRLVIVDELDAKLHPKLLRYIISLFKNPQINKNGAQLLFTSHDLTTMNNKVFRRDEIWFAALNRSRISEIYSLYDFRTENDNHINSTASFSKQYMEGRYGADPYLRNILHWEERL